MAAQVHRYYSPPRWWLPSALAVMCLAAMLILPMGALFVAFDFDSGTAVLKQAYTWRVVKFTVWQALLSTVLSLSLALPMAMALSRYGEFYGRSLLLRLFSVPLVMPTLVAITGIVVVYGHSGWLRNLLQSIGVGEHYTFYGLIGILIAHVFFNFPLATRVFLQAIDGVAQENWRLAEQLGIPGQRQFLWLEWPAIARVLPNISILIFSLCFTSFAVVLTLGGGPRASTIEVAVYQALRLDFDIPTAVVLALLQITICTGLLLLSSVLGRPVFFGGRDAIAKTQRLPQRSPLLLFIIATGFVCISTPLLAVLIRGANSELYSLITGSSLWRATGLTATIGIASAVFAVLLACGLLLGSRHLQLRKGYERSGRLLSGLSLLILAAPAVVISAGLFLLLRNTVDVFAHAIWLIIAVNALLALPFATAVMSEGMQTAAERHDRLCAALGISGLNRMRLIEWPLLKKPLGLALGMCSALAAGDLGAIALFGSQHLQTLPLLLYQRVGSYRIAEASATALVLLLLCIALFAFFERIVGGHKRAAA